MPEYLFLYFFGQGQVYNGSQAFQKYIGDGSVPGTEEAKIRIGATEAGVTKNISEMKLPPWLERQKYNRVRATEAAVAKNISEFELSPRLESPVHCKNSSGNFSYREWMLRMISNLLNV